MFHPRSNGVEGEGERNTMNYVHKPLIENFANKVAEQMDIDILCQFGKLNSTNTVSICIDGKENLFNNYGLCLDFLNSLIK